MDKSYYAELANVRLIRAKELIRSSSDYDDFYLASKSETKDQIENAAYIVEKIEKYMTEHMK